MRKWLVFVFILTLVLGGFVVYDYLRFYDGKLHVIFCNVGQGDAIFIRTPKGKKILVDGGPDQSVISCLSSHLPFWERTLNIIFLTHPHDDHMTGIYYVIDRYTALAFDTVDLSNTTSGYRMFINKLKQAYIPLNKIFAGDTFRTSDNVNLEVESPTRNYLHQISPQGTIGESKEQGSLILHIAYGSFDVLLTGDSQAEGLEQAVNGTEETEETPLRQGYAGQVEVLQVPHHGSKTGLNKEIVDRLNPALAVISVGKNNYGHPSKETLQLLINENIKVLRTDKSGDIEIVSDGKKWFVQKQYL
jgi:competence protein ComEC